VRAEILLDQYDPKLNLQIMIFFLVLTPCIVDDYIVSIFRVEVSGEYTFVRNFANHLQDYTWS
jgi:hypothetical protein